MRSGLKALLKSLNAEIMEASNGLDGLNLVSENHFDLIVTSVDMPKMDGLELCRRVKSTPTTQDIPVIVLSSFDSDADIDNAIQAGASAYIEKREARNRLYDSVQEILSKSPSQPERTIMVVDDSRSISILIQKGLMEAGFRVISAGNGKEALALLSKDRPDLILTDINMPEMDGFAFCEAVHADPDFATIPFVVMSTISDRDQMRRIIKYGATDYMVKPFNVDELVIHIERFLADRFLLLLKDKERLDMEREMLLGSITSLLAVLEARDPRFRDHAEAVAKISAGMAALAGATKKEIEMVTLGARLHDIGKIGLKDEILFKSESLTNQEMGFYKQHPRIGSNILQSIPHLPPEIGSIVLFHHERPDGKGYPKGLKADQIPKWAGITAVANKYQVLTTVRPYGQGMLREKALQCIEDLSGTELCQEYVYLFLDWMASNEDGK
jgi:response regulator RpfG family c-di-GMP phosphodiesterase